MTTTVLPSYAAANWRCNQRLDCSCSSSAIAAVNTPSCVRIAPLAHLWMHGHVHDSFDYEVEGCRVVANPRGYVRNVYEAGAAKDLAFENASFQWACALDV